MGGLVLGRGKFFSFFLPSFLLSFVMEGIDDDERCDANGLLSGDNSLAYCEVYIMTALMAFHVIPRANLVDTTRENFDYDHDMIVPQTKFGSISCKIAIQ